MQPGRPACSIFVGHNFFGAGNFGDDLALAGFLRGAAQRPGARITICTPHDIASQRRRFPEIRWLPEDGAARDEALRTADVWLGLGGTPFQHDSGPWFLDHVERERERCAALGKPMYLLGVGCESAEAAADPRSRALLAGVEHVWTRDARSARTLRPYLAPSRLTTGADVAHLAFGDQTAPPPREPGVAGLLLAFERRDQFVLSELETFVARRAPGRTRWLVQEVRALPYVERWILAALAPDARERLRVMDADYATSSVDAYLRAFGAPDVTVTSRYHGAIAAAWHGSRVLVVARSDKLRGVADDLGVPCIERIDSHAALEAALATARPVSRKRLHALRDGAQLMCDAFFDVVARAVSAPAARESSARAGHR